MKTKQTFKDNYSWCIPGRNCWVSTSTSEVFLPGKIVSVDETSNKVEVSFHKAPENPLPTVYELSAVLEFNEQSPSDQQFGYEDMVTMDCLNEAELLNNLALRYSQDNIFTYIGPTLLVINPYKPINAEFSSSKVAEYQSLTKAELFNLKEKLPHVYAIAGKAYHQLFSNARNQAIVISGESGAGKTENTKYAMQFLTTLSQEDKALDKAESPIEERILGCNPILEAFGNAKTVRNDNSSRFGKYVRILVEKHSKKIKGAGITNYLLEKSRVTTQASGERNYHIFYQLFKMKPENMGQQFLDSLHLHGKSLEDFEYLKSSKGVTLALSDEEFLNDVLFSFEKMQFRADEKQAVFRLLAGILYLGNVSFNDEKFSENQPCEIQGKEALKLACEILGFSENSLAKALVVKTREIGKQLIESPVNKIECGFLRDSLTKALYEKLFNWLVKRLNLSILPLDDLKKARTVRKSIKEMRKSILLQQETARISIGLLDIFGFENFLTNSFEQLCINFTNEKLQQLYIAYVFKSEEAEFIEQGLKDQLYRLSYEDNQPIIDLIDKYPLGIFDLLEESCSLGSGTDEALLQKIGKTHKDNNRMGLPKLHKDRFVLTHTAKAVEYTITGFRVKNKDNMNKELENAILSSTYQSIVEIYENKIDKAEENAAQPSKKGEKTLAAKFRVQMKDLMQELMSCDVNFIRCIKPNEEKRPDFFIAGFVLQQIKYLGVLESIRIRKDGFPYRKEYKNFVETYKSLLKGSKVLQKLKDKENIQKQVEWLLNNLLSEEIARNKSLFGKTKLYLKQEVSISLDKLLMELYKEKKARAKQILSQYRRFKFRALVLEKLSRLHNKIIMKFVKLQAMQRRKIARRVFLCKKQAVTKFKRILLKRLMKRIFLRWHEKILLFRKWTKKKQASVKLFNQFKRTYRRFFWKKWQQKTVLLVQMLRKKAMEERERQEKEEKDRRENEEREKLRQKEEEVKQREIEQAAAEKSRKQAEKALQQAASLKNLHKIPGSPSKMKKKEPEFAEETKKDAVLSQILQENAEETELIVKPLTIPEIPRSEEKKSAEIDLPKIIEMHTKSRGIINLSQLKTINPAFFLNLKSGIPMPKSADLSVDLFLSGRRKNTQLFALYSEDVVFDLQGLDVDFVKNITRHTFWEFVEPLVGHHKSWGKSVSIASVMSFSKSSQNIPVLAHSDSKERDLSNKQFSNLKKFLLTKDFENELLLSMKILMEGFNGNAALRDETYLQIIKQLNNNPDKFLRLKLYKLLGLIGSTFPLSIWTFGVVMSFLFEIVQGVNKIESEEEVILHAKFAFNRIRKTYESGGKKFPPLEHELKSLWNLKKIPIKLSFLNGKVITIFVESWTRVQAIYQQIEEILMMKNISLYIGLAIRESVGDDYFLEDNSILIEELTRLEFKRMKDNTKHYRALLKLRVYYPNLFQENAKDIKNLTFYQVLDEYLCGHFPCPTSEILTLSSLYLYIEKEGVSCEKIFNLESSADNLEIGIDIEKYIPKGSINKSFTKQNFLEIILKRYLESRENKPIDQSKVDFMNCLRKYDEFMSYKFSAKYIKVQIKKGDLDETLIEEVVVYIKPFVILILGNGNKSKTVFHFKEIEAFGRLNNPKEMFAFRTFDLQIHLLETPNGSEMENIIEKYLELLRQENF